MELVYSGESKFIIPTNINEIAEKQFYFSELKEITIPSNIKKIGNEAFEFSVKLKKVIIEEGVEEIGDSVFENCDALEEVVIPNSVKKIGKNAFFSCEKLKKVNIPQNITILKDSVFFDCESLTKIIIPESVEIIEENVFFDCEKLEKVNIPEKVKKIPTGVFQNCSSLKKIIIPEGVTEIEVDAFRGCKSLEEISLPKSMTLLLEDKTKIQESFTKDCVNLKAINVHPNNPAFSSADGVLFNKAKTLLISYPLGKEGEYIIPDSVTEIAKKAFYKSQSVEKITLGKNVKTIGEDAFFSCLRLKEIVGNSVFVSEDGVLFNSDKSVLICYPIAKETKEYTIPDSVKSFGWEFVGSPNITKLIIGKGLETIFGNFDMCRNLVEFVVDPENKNFTSEDGILFDKNKTQLRRYPLGKNEELYKLDTAINDIYTEAFLHCSNLKDIAIPRKQLVTGLRAFKILAK